MVDVKSREIKPKDAGESTETWGSVAMDYEEINEISPHVVKAEAAEVPHCATQCVHEDIFEVTIDVKAENSQVHEEPTEVGSENTHEDAAVELKNEDAEVTEEPAEIPRDDTPKDTAVDVEDT